MVRKCIQTVSKMVLTATKLFLKWSEKQPNGFKNGLKSNQMVLENGLKSNQMVLENGLKSNQMVLENGLEMQPNGIVNNKCLKIFRKHNQTF